MRTDSTFERWYEAGAYIRTVVASSETAADIIAGVVLRTTPCTHVGGTDRANRYGVVESSISRVGSKSEAEEAGCEGDDGRGRHAGVGVRCGCKVELFGDGKYDKLKRGGVTIADEGSG